MRQNDSKSSDTLFVLMVDDDREDVYSMQRAFAACHFPPRFESCSSGDELFAKLTGLRAANVDDPVFPDLILLDLNLPKTTGFEILGRLRSEPEPNLTPVFVLTTSDSEADVVRSYKGGASVFFTKPTTFSETKRIAEAIVTFWKTPGVRCVRHRLL